MIYMHFTCSLGAIVTHFRMDDIDHTSVRSTAKCKELLHVESVPGSTCEGTWPFGKKMEFIRVVSFAISSIKKLFFGVPLLVIILF
jgi:hypothetical protein